MQPTPSADLRSQFGDIDIYLFDQILKGRFDRRLRVLDAGAGDGRNLIYFLRHGFACFGIDREEARRRARSIACRDACARGFRRRTSRPASSTRCRGPTTAWTR